MKDELWLLDCWFNLDESRTLVRDAGMSLVEMIFSLVNEIMMCNSVGFYWRHYREIHC